MRKNVPTRRKQIRNIEIDRNDGFDRHRPTKTRVRVGGFQPGRALLPLRNFTKIPEPTMVKTLVKEDEPDKEKQKRRQNESTSHHIRFVAQEVLSSTTEIRCF